MSQGIRDQVHGYIEYVLTDKRLEEIREILKTAAEKHEISIPITVKIGVDNDGLASVRISGTVALKIPHWDSPIDLTGQMSLFTDPPDAQPRAEATPAEEVENLEGLDIPLSELETATVNPGGAIPAGVDLDVVLGDPPNKPPQNPAAEPLSPRAALQMEKRLKANEALLARADAGEFELSPDAEKALKEQIEAAKGA